MKKWEYKLFSSFDIPGTGLFKEKRSREALEVYLNSLGNEGWEIIGVDFIDIRGKESYFAGIAKREKR